LRLYLDARVITDLTEIDGLPEPMRSRLQDLVAQARARVEARIAETESRQAS
jgi:hypothetical protein